MHVYVYVCILCIYIYIHMFVSVCISGYVIFLQTLFLKVDRVFLLRKQASPEEA